MAHEFDGKEYEKASAHQREWGNRLISELNFSGNEKILDLGCGDGTLSFNLAKRVPDGSVIGIDASRGMIETASEKEAGNLRFRLMDINDIKFDNKFDLVFSNATLHWVKDHMNLWNSVAKLLNPSGIARFDFAAAGNCDNFFAATRETLGLDEFKRYFIDYEWPYHMPSLEEYENILVNTPFTDIKIEGQNADRYFADMDTITAWINPPSIVPFLEVIPSTAREIFRAKVIERTLEKTLREEGRHFETFRRIDVFARRNRA